MKLEQPIKYTTVYIWDKKFMKKMGVKSNVNSHFKAELACNNLDDLIKLLCEKYPIFKKAKYDSSFPVDYFITFKTLSIRKHGVGFVDFVRDKIESKTTSMDLDNFDLLGIKALAVHNNFDLDNIEELPNHEQDGYWSGERGYTKPSINHNYQEGMENIRELQRKHNKLKFPNCIPLNEGDIYIYDFDDFDQYIKYMLHGLITDGGCNFIRYIVVKKPLSKNCKGAIGLFLVRCGDCGKVAQGLFKGNPDMGDYYYQTYHRKNWFCNNYGWTYMGGHNHPDGRRMICPECSQEYASGKRMINDNTLC